MRTRWTVAFALTAIGLVWVGQGVGILGGSSFMVGDARWAIAGVVLTIGGLLLGLLTLRNRRPA